MLDDLRPYPEYRDSGVPWAGAIPAHWEVRRNGRLFGERNETGFAELPILEVSLRTGVRVRPEDGTGRKQMMSDRSKYKRAVRGDVAYNIMRMWQGAVGVAPVDGLVSPAYVVAQPFPEVEPRYFSYLFRTDAYMDEVDGFSRGIVKDRNRLYWEDFKRMPSLFPPPDEQQRIVRFLDAHGQKVAAFIRNRRRLMELLNEQKQAIITRAVTRGLNSDVPMKASGVDWIGEFPEHWGVMRLKSALTSVEQGWCPPSETRTANPGEWAVLKAGCTNGARFRPEEHKALAPGVAPLTQYVIRRDDVLMSRANTRELVGSAACVESDPTQLLLCDKIYRLHLRDGILDRRFLIGALSSRPTRLQIESAASGASSSMQNIQQDVVRELILPVPPIDEQQRIARQLKVDTLEIEETVSRTERQIALVREYHARLVSDVVMGRVDVRHLAPERVEDEVDGLGMLDADDEAVGEYEEDAEGEGQVDEE
jgi:type I restriction enzyme, S subunit